MQFIRNKIKLHKQGEILADRIDFFKEEFKQHQQKFVSKIQ